VRRFKRSHPSFKLRLYSKRQRQDRIEALIAGYNRSQKNELILVIDASDVISPTLLRDSAMRFMHDKKLQALNFDYISTNLSSITMLLQRFKTMSQALVNKFFTTMPGYRINLRGKGMFRQASFKKACKSQVVKAKYDSSLRVLDYGINDDRAVITYQFVRSDWTINYLFVALLALVFQTYSMYVAATLQSKFLLIIGCIATAFWLLLITWASDSLALKDKIKLSFCAPIIYFLIYIQLIVYILSVVFHATTSLARIARGFVRDVVN
jgi:hypothetical protein